jgi:uncharacterized protein YbdZ (MbtH family)
MIQTKHRYSGAILYEGEHQSTKEAVAAAIGSGADLRWADLRGADLRWADLSWADLRWADLRGADLRWADLSWADLSWADLREANLSWADLSWADLRGADLRWADLSEADLSWAKIKFRNFPTKTLLSMYFGELSEALTVELMCRDAWASPHPEAFIEWANGGEGCPLNAENGVERLWSFRENREWLKEHLDAGGELKPQMRDSDLIKAICEAKGWELP